MIWSREGRESSWVHVSLYPRAVSGGNAIPGPSRDRPIARIACSTVIEGYDEDQHSHIYSLSPAEVISLMINPPYPKADLRSIQSRRILSTHGFHLMGVTYYGRSRAGITETTPLDSKKKDTTTLVLDKVESNRRCRSMYTKHAGRES